MAEQDLYLLLIHQIGQTGGLQLGIAVISLSSAWLTAISPDAGALGIAAFTSRFCSRLIDSGWVG